MKKAIFLDRDGVINKDYGYIHSIDKFKFNYGVFEALRIFQKMGFLIIIITNQSGIARGYFSENDYEKLTEYYLKILSKNKIKITAHYHCPHHPDFSEFPLNDCDCRKPKSGLFIKATKDFNIDIKSSIAIGDNLRDLEPAHYLGISRKYLISCSNEINSIIVNKKFKTLLECAKFINS